jgi:hypothetical protein
MGISERHSIDAVAVAFWMAVSGAPRSDIVKPKILICAQLAAPLNVLSMSVMAAFKLSFDVIEDVAPLVPGTIGHNGVNGKREGH